MSYRNNRGSFWDNPFGTFYRVVPTPYGFHVQTWRWWWPFWIEYWATFRSEREAHAYIKGHSTYYDGAE